MLRLGFQSMLDLIRRFFQVCIHSMVSLWVRSNVCFDNNFCFVCLLFLTSFILLWMENNFLIQLQYPRQSMLKFKSRWSMKTSSAGAEISDGMHMGALLTAGPNDFTFVYTLMQRNISMSIIFVFSFCFVSHVFAKLSFNLLTSSQLKLKLSLVL